MGIHPTAYVDRAAEIAADVEIGRNAYIEGPVRIGAGTRVYPNAYISGEVTIGERCEVHPGAVIGHLPQDFHFTPGTRSSVRIGNGVIIREGASIHRGTQPDSETVIGDNCFLLGHSHVGHNCVLAEGVKLYNNSLLAGHVEVGRNAIFSGLVAIHQFVRVGEGVMIGGGSILSMDLPPFMMSIERDRCVGINAIGLRRTGRDAATIRKVKEAYGLLYRSGRLFRAAVAELEAVADCAETRAIVEFCRAPSRRGILGPRARADFSDAD